MPSCFLSTHPVFDHVGFYGPAGMSAVGGHVEDSVFAQQLQRGSKSPLGIACFGLHAFVTARKVTQVKDDGGEGTAMTLCEFL